MFARLALLLLVCAFVVPKAAWGAHLAGHEQLASATSVHTHHSGHAHEHASEKTSVNEQEADDAGSDADTDKGLTHDHRPSLSLATALLLPNEPQISSWFEPADLRFDPAFAAVAPSRPESLLRPPRAA